MTKKNNNTKITPEKSLIDSIGGDLSSLGIDVGETALDQFLEDSLLREIPVIKNSSENCHVCQDAGGGQENEREPVT
jgi:hypothetical protein